MSHFLPSTSLNQESPVKLIARDGVGVDTSDPVTVSAPCDLAPAILKTCGVVSLGVRTVMVSNLESGMPNTYSFLAEQCGMSLSGIHRAVRPMIKHGFVVVESAGGGRGNETVLAPVNHVRNPFRNHVTDDMESQQTMSETMSETMSKPPTPPVSLLVSKDLNKQTDEQTARRNGEDESTTINPADSVWLPMLGDRVGSLERKFGKISDEFTGGLVRGMLLDAEARCGSVPEPALLQGLQSAVTAIERQLKAESTGGRPIRSLRRYGSKIIATKIAEVMA